MFEEFSTQMFATQRGRQVGLALSILLSVILLTMLFTTFSTWYSDFLLTQRKVVTTAAPVTDEVSLAISQIPTLHLFGMSSEADAAFLPITSLQLHLTGIIKVYPDNLSKAIISEAGQPGKVYAVGDVLTAGIKISAVNDNGVVLEHGGRLEKLPLARSVLSFQDAPKSLL
ncbi:MAG: type II secretion system protein N [Gammaproteobacteria bacterium]|nr:type II secretion system protein N [Gammaproteobacteria bacterium]